MIIWGSRTTNKPVTSGRFHCPRCGPEKTYDLIQVNRWFTLYFIPLIPMGSEGKYVKCKACAGTFDQTAIDYDPVVANADFAAKVDTALVRCFLVLALASPPVTDDVLLAIADIMERKREREIGLERLRELLNDTQGQKMSVKSALSGLTPLLSDEGRSMVIRILATHAPAMAAPQRKVLEDAGTALGFSKKALEPLFVPAIADAAAN